MKKWSFGWTALMAAMLLLPASGFAQVKYLKITVKSANLWPARVSGKCWDPCFGKKFQHPARGNKNFAKYFENANFRNACTGSKAPDGLVEIEIGKYEKFTTDKKNNTCTPKFNVGKVFRVGAKDTFTVSVYDNDGAAGFQAKRDLMGKWTSATIPKELANGGTMTIRSFGQVEELVLQAEVVQKPKVAAGGTCDGVYKVRVVEVEVHATKANGKSWDRGFGSSKKPDIMVILQIGSESIPPKDQLNKLVKKFIARNKLQATITNLHATMAIKKGQAVKLKVLDADLFNRKETIGETAESDVCKIINASGKHVFTNFGRVKKVVVLFSKEK